jgi:hypothetical protein
MLTFPINHWSGGEIPTNGLRFSSVDANYLVAHTHRARKP